MDQAFNEPCDLRAPRRAIRMINGFKQVGHALGYGSSVSLGPPLARRQRYAFVSAWPSVAATVSSPERHPNSPTHRHVNSSTPAIAL